MLDKFIFVNYVPGSFGSFLTKVIELSTEVETRSKTNESDFDSTGAAHNNITEWITYFHHGDDLDNWLTFTDSDKIKYITDNLICSNTNKNKTHRLTIPAKNDVFIKFFPTAKFIKITMCNQYLDIVASLMAKKTFQGWLEHEMINNPIKFKIMQRLNKTQQNTAYKNICHKRILGIMSDTTDINTFNFGIEEFFQYDTFYKKYIEMCKFLNISHCDITTIYNEFKNINQDYFKVYE